MDTIFSRCAGLDIHKVSVEATIRRQDQAEQFYTETRHFATTTSDLLALSDWLVSHGISHVAMESTGVYWKPVYNILESPFEVLLVNAKHVKQVPGRKTDVKDSQWICHLLQCGLLKGSFVPPRPIRDLRDLTRQRAQLVAEKTRAINRIHKTLEDANIKLSSVATDIMGASGRAMIQALIAGEHDPVVLAELARRRLREKIPHLQKALEGHVTDHHRFLLQLLWDQLSQLEALIERLQARLEELTCPFESVLTTLGEIPGIDQASAQSILAELGPDMSPFPSAAHLASWAGICPGNNESAGKRKSGKTTKGSRWLRSTLVQAAWAASHTQESYFYAQYHRLARRRGKKRALIAVAHSMLVMIYHIIKTDTSTSVLERSPPHSFSSPTGKPTQAHQ